MGEGNKQPTNREIITAIEAVSTRVENLETWKRNEDAYRAALAKVKEEEQSQKQSNRDDTYYKRRTELMKQGAIVLGLIAAILYAYMTTKGIKQ